ncbi:hypothetical protein E4O04_01685 [Treponema sp. OMZ 799]|uniref:hypothetical protein n=1 Tax=Treponema sp. OMZ 799 TaxID=2563668 RepID=UPI0020A4FDEC|nr:hypothetical protein [Treponema sp. OMZ 799]UTC76795.1 hypothetical protein E4O04_01685 [Treponema sp. OMZ 799]
MNIRRYFLRLFFLIFSLILYSEEKFDDEDYQYFLKINSGYIEASETFLTEQAIIKYNKDLKEESRLYSYCLFNKSGQFVRIKSKNKIQYFFSSNEGYWLYNKNLKTPLKISGAYKIEEFEVQDILKTDFKSNYKIIEYKNNDFILEKQNSKASYKYIIFTKKAKNIFELKFTDAKQTPIKKLVYHIENIDGYPCFAKIDVYDMLFEKNAYSSWITMSIKKADIPASLFSYSQLKHLTQKMENLIKK